MAGVIAPGKLRAGRRHLRRDRRHRLPAALTTTTATVAFAARRAITDGRRNGGRLGLGVRRSGSSASNRVVDAATSATARSNTSTVPAGRLRDATDLADVLPGGGFDLLRGRRRSQPAELGDVAAHVAPRVRPRVPSFRHAAQSGDADAWHHRPGTALLRSDHDEQEECNEHLPRVPLTTPHRQRLPRPHRSTPATRHSTTTSRRSARSPTCCTTRRARPAGPSSILACSIASATSRSKVRS